MKGRQNYLCRSRLNMFLSQPMFATMDESHLFNKVLDWAQSTNTGDREELTDLPDDFAAWNDINSSSNHCRGQRCFYG